MKPDHLPADWKECVLDAMSAAALEAGFPTIYAAGKEVGIGHSTVKGWLRSDRESVPNLRNIFKFAKACGKSGAELIADAEDRF